MAEHWTIINWTVKIKKRSARLVSRMIGEFLRDGGILVIVFGILDRLSGKNGNGELSVRWVGGCLAVGTGGFILGTLFGVWGQQPEEGEPE